MRIGARNRLLGVIAVGLGALLIYGCATIVSGTSQMLTFQSEPEGATVTVNGRLLGKTPVTIQLDRQSTQTVSFELEGYKTISMPLTTTVEPWFWGNILIGGVIGSTTDGISGAIYEYAPDHYYVSLVPAGGFAKPLKARVQEFIVAGYPHLAADLEAARGEYLDSLLRMLKVEEDGREEAIASLRELLRANADIAVFARAVAEHFVK